MTQFRPFEPYDLPFTIAGIAYGLVFGFLGILVLWFVLFDFGWMILLLGLPFLAVHLAFIFAFDRFLKWRRRNDPPPPPCSWARFHAASLGAATGSAAALIFLIAGHIYEGAL